MATAIYHPPPDKDTSPPLAVKGLVLTVGPAEFREGVATNVTKGGSITSVRITGSDVVIPIDTGHKSSPTPEFYPGQPLRFFLRRAYITTGSCTRDDFIVAYQVRPTPPVPQAELFARAARMGTTAAQGQRFIATTAPAHAFWVGPRDQAVRIPSSKLDTGAEVNCISWDVYTDIRTNLEAVGSPLLTSESVTLQGAFGSKQATVFGTVQNVPLFLHDQQHDPVFADFVVINGSSPVLLGAPFMDQYFKLIDIEEHYFTFYRTPRHVRQHTEDDYTGELVQVPFQNWSREVHLNSIEVQAIVA